MLTLPRLFRSTRLAREEGQVLPMFAAGAVAMLLMTGIVVDGGNLFQNRQALQNAADAAALAGALYIAAPAASCQGAASVGACAGKYAGLNGSTDGAGNKTTQLGACSAAVTDTTPPPTPPGCYEITQQGQVEVWLTRKTSDFFGGLVGLGTSTQSARAVASLTAGGTPPPYSFVALQSDGENHTLLVKNSSVLNVANSLYVNSCGGQVGCQPTGGNVHDSFDVFGAGGTITDAHDIFVAGGWETKNGDVVGANGGTCIIDSAVLVYTPNVQVNGNTVDTATPSIPIKWNAGPAPHTGDPVGVNDVIQIGTEQMLVTAVGASTFTGAGGSTGNATLTVQRSYNSTTAASHGTGVVVNQVAVQTASYNPVITTNGSVDGTTTTLNVSGNPVNNVDPGDVIQIVNSDGTKPPEQMQVVSVGTHSLTVVRGYNGTTSTAHATGVEVKEVASPTNVSGPSGSPSGGPCPTVGRPYLPDPFALLTQPTPDPQGGSGNLTFPVTQKAAAHGIATLTVANSLQAGSAILVSGVDPNFDGIWTVSTATATQLTYVDSNLPATKTINATAVSMTASVATVTDSNDTFTNGIANGDSATNVNFGNANYDGAGPFSISGITANTFQYTPGLSVPVLSGSITGGVATVTTSGSAGIPSGATNLVTVTTGDEAYDGTSVTPTSTGPAASSFTYTPPKIANVNWMVNSPTSATFTSTGTHDANITSITIAGANASLNKTFSTPNLSVGSNTFTVAGSGFSSTAAYPGPAGPVTLNGALGLALTSVPIKWSGGAAQAANDPVAVGDTIQVDSEQMVVTARGTAANNQATLTVTRHANGTTAATHNSGVAVNKVTFPTGTNATVTVNTAASTTFSPAFPNADETAVKLASIPSPGSLVLPYFLAPTSAVGGTVSAAATAINPVPTVLSSGSLPAGTYYGGICLGSSNGTDCVGNHCAASGTPSVAKTVTLQGTYVVAGGGFQVCGNVSLNAPNVLIYSTSDPYAAPAATYGAVGQVEINTTGTVTLGPQTISQDPFYAGFTIIEDRAQVVDPPAFTQTAFTPAQTLAAPGISSTATTFAVNGTATQGIYPGNVICLGASGSCSAAGDEMMMVTAVTQNGAVSTLTVTRGYDGTTPASWNAGTAVKSVNYGGDSCDSKANTALKGDHSLMDVALLSAGAPSGGYPLDNISGTIYAAGPRADFENTLYGTANLAVLTSCIFIDGGAVPSGAPPANFNFDPTDSNPLGALTASLTG